MRPFVTIPALAFLAAAAFAQPAPPLTFDVASVKPAAPQGEGRMMIGMRGGPGTPDPGQMTWTNASLMMLLTTAYDVKNFQVTGPDWLNTERFDIAAKLAPGTTKDQSHVMLQNLLAERFHLALHRESKEVQGYELIVGKNGPKLKESSPADAAASDPGPQGPPGPPKRDANGFPQLDRPGMVAMIQVGPKGPVARLAAKAQPLSELMRMLGNQFSRPVVDKTGLTGKYDFTLEYAPDMSAMGPLPPSAPGGLSPEGGDDSTPNMLTAVQEQLGLKLDSKKIQVDILIVDKIEKIPTEN